MAEEVKPKTTKPKAEKVVPEVAEVAVKESVEEVAPVEAVVEPPVVEPVVADDLTSDDDVEAMGKRGRKSKAEIAEAHKRTREDIESNYCNMIDHEPHKADLFRDELRQILIKLGLM